MSLELTDMSHKIKYGYLLGEIISHTSGNGKYVVTSVDETGIDVQKLSDYQKEARQPIKMQQQKPYYQRGRW